LTLDSGPETIHLPMQVKEARWSLNMYKVKVLFPTYVMNGSRCIC